MNEQTLVDTAAEEIIAEEKTIAYTASTKRYTKQKFSTKKRANRVRAQIAKAQRRKGRR